MGTHFFTSACTFVCFASLLDTKLTIDPAGHWLMFQLQTLVSIIYNHTKIIACAQVIPCLGYLLCRVRWEPGGRFTNILKST